MFDPQQVQSHDAPDHVDEGVDLSQLVEPDLLRRGAVDGRLRLRQPLEDGARAIDHPRVQGRTLDGVDEVLPPPGPLAELIELDRHSGPAHRAALGRSMGQREAADAEVVQGGGESLEGGACVDDCAENHVSAGPADAVEVGASHGPYAVG